MPSWPGAVPARRAGQATGIQSQGPGPEVRYTSPMRSLLLLLAVVAAVPAPLTAQTFILVRHAEKADNSDDTELSAQGRGRAERLAGMLAEAGVTNVIATEYKRTKQTVAAVAKARGLEIETVPAQDTAALAERLKALPPDAVALVAGHSNSTPRLLAALGHATPITIEEPDFGNVFIVVPREGQEPEVVRLRY